MANGTALPAPGARRIPAQLALLATIALLSAVAALGLSPTMMQPNPDRWQLARLATTIGIPLIVIACWQQIRAVRAQKVDAAVAVAAQATANQLETASRSRLSDLLGSLHGPVTSILTFSKHLTDPRLIDPTETASLIALIERDAEEAERIIENLESAWRLEAGTLDVTGAPVDLLDLARTTAARLDFDTKSIQVHGNTAFAWADQALIGRVVRNLAVNAMRHGGDRIDLVVNGDEKGASLTVSDDGPGLPAADADRMTGASETGAPSDWLLSGLGVAQAIAAEMGGALTYERRLGWSHLIVSLPAAPADVLAASVTAAD